MPKKAPNGERLLRVLLILEGVGGAWAQFRYRDLYGKYGARWTEETIRRWHGNGTFLRLSRGLYQLSDSAAAKGKAWLASEEAEAFRDKIAEEEADRFLRDEEELQAMIEGASLQSPWKLIAERIEEEARLRKTQIGKAILALRAAGRALTRSELLSLGVRLSNEAASKGVSSGLLIRPKFGSYDLPERSRAPIERSRREGVLLTLAARGPSTMIEIGDAIRVHYDILKTAALKRARAQGLVRRTPPKHYELTPEGWQAVKAILSRSAKH